MTSDKENLPHTTMSHASTRKKRTFKGKLTANNREPTWMREVREKAQAVGVKITRPWGK